MMDYPSKFVLNLIKGVVNSTLFFMSIFFIQKFFIILMQTEL